MIYGLHRALRKYVLLCAYCEGFDSAVSIGDFGLSGVRKEISVKGMRIVPRIMYNMYLFCTYISQSHDA